jgi:hypothetical protein
MHNMNIENKHKSPTMDDHHDRSRGPIAVLITSYQVPTDLANFFAMNVEVLDVDAKTQLQNNRVDHLKGEAT